MNCDLASVFTRKLVFVTGKGGVGKTTLTGLLAQEAAKQGLKVLLIENTFFGQLAPLFAVESEIHVQKKYAENIEGINFSARGNFKDFLTLHLKMPALFEPLSNSKTIMGFLEALPGFAEALFLGRIYYAVELSKQKFDLVLVDSYASGHFLSLMTTPFAIVQSGLTGPLVRETDKILSLLRDPKKTSVVYVGVPEDLVITEMQDFLPKLHRECPAKLGTVILNRMPFFSSDAYAEKISSQKNSARIFADWKSSSEIAGLPLLELPEVGWIEVPLDVPNFFENWDSQKAGEKSRS